MSARSILERGGTPAGRGALLIRSRDNPTFKALIALRHTRGIVRAHAAIVPGMKLAKEAARDPTRCKAQVVVEGSGGQLPGIAVITLSRALFRELDVWGTGPPLLVIDAPDLPLWDRPEWPEGCTVIIPMQDPRNVGAALRCAAAFGASGVILTAEAAHPFHPEAVRPAAGTQWLLSLFRGPPLDEGAWLPRPLLVLDKGGTPMQRASWPARFGMLVGMEGPGIPDALRDVVRLAIPMRAPVESLNASTALAVALYAWSTRPEHGEC